MNRDILILFEDLKPVETSSPIGGCMVWWVGGWLSGLMGGAMSNHKKSNNLDLIEIIQFCLKIYDLLRHPHLWVGVWVVGWLGGWVG